MTQGQYCHYCGGFYHHSHICCYEIRDGGSNIQNVVTTTYTETEYNNYSSSSSSSSVDCTLSLGTPSTRLSEKDEKNKGSYLLRLISPTSRTPPKRRRIMPFPVPVVGFRAAAILYSTTAVPTVTQRLRLFGGMVREVPSRYAMRVEFVSREETRTATAVTAGSNVAEDQYGNQSSHDAAIDIKFFQDFGRRWS